MTPQVGSSIVLWCDAHGVPEPEVTWYKNGRQLAKGNGLKINGHQLEVIGVQVGRNALRHRCVRLEAKQNPYKDIKWLSALLVHRIVDVCYLMSADMSQQMIGSSVCLQSSLKNTKRHDNIHIDAAITGFSLQKYR